MSTSTSQERLPIAVILCRPEISRNIGAVCRSMANNNCSDLRIIGNKKDYDEEIGRPNTKWEDVTISHVAFRHLMEGTSEQFDSIISDIKQWTVNKNAKIEVIDKKGNKISLPPYLDLDENSENYIDPVEIYAYYIGSYINTMTNGIYL